MSFWYFLSVSSPMFVLVQQKSFAFEIILELRGKGFLNNVVRRSTGGCAAADSWYMTGWESRGSGASQHSGRFQSVWPRRAELWCPLVGPGGRPLCILPLSGTGNRHRYSAVRAELNTTTSRERRLMALSDGTLRGDVLRWWKSTLFISLREMHWNIKSVAAHRGTNTSRTRSNQTAHNPYTPCRTEPGDRNPSWASGFGVYAIGYVTIWKPFVFRDYNTQKRCVE